MNYYNEFDTKTAAWLRQLIKNGVIADGEVDERSIVEVEPDDLKGFTQHHFFAGIGVWSYALRNAGWTDDRSVWTASLPCQPFSVAGNQKGKEDERHLLPHFIELVSQCKPDTIFGEQVPGSIKHGWLDDLYDEMEREDYAVGSTVLTAAGAGKAHIRQRLYWVASSRFSNAENRNRGPEPQCTASFGGETWDEPGMDGPDCGVAHAMQQRQQRPGEMGQSVHPAESKNRQVDRVINDSNIGSGMVQSDRNGCEQGSKTSSTSRHGSSIDTTSGVDWLYCRDNKYRPIREGIKPLVRKFEPSSIEVVNRIAGGVVHSSDSVITPNDSAEARAIRLKGYGNAIVAPVAEQFIRAFMSV